MTEPAYSPRRLVFLTLALLSATISPAPAADQPQWGQKFTRNMVSGEKGLPDSFDPAAGRNLKWAADLGTQSFATPTVAGGRVYIGTNNEKPRDPAHKGDRAVFMCFDEADGHLLWQLVVPKLSADEHDDYLDWPKVGMASAPTIEGDRVYTLTNRGEVVCLDAKGMNDGNDGPYRDEAKHMAPRGAAPEPVGATDADILWVCDLVAEAGIHTHDQVHGSILIDGDFLYINSCNGVDDTHRKIRAPEAPSLVVLDKKTGRIIARDDQRIGPNVFHCTWSSPAIGEVNGRRLVFFGGDDGVCYAFEPLKDAPPEGTIAKLKTVWKFDTDPTAPKAEVHKWVGNRQESPSVIMGMPVFDAGKIYLTRGGDLWWGKRQGWLHAIDAGGTGDVTATAGAWTYPLSRETGCTPAVYGGMVFATDCGGVLHCVDAATGKPLWTHKANGEFWASPLVADGKVYAGTRRGQVVIFAADREKKLLGTADLGGTINGTATAANGTIYISTMTRLFAFARQTAVGDVR